MKLNVRLKISNIRASQKTLLSQLLFARRFHYWSKTTSFIFVAIGFHQNGFVNAASFFYSLGALNILLIDELSDSLKIFSFNPFLNPEEIYEVRANA